MPRATLASLRRRLPAPFQLLVLLALTIVPLIYAGSLIDANLDPTENLDHVPAAVVDADTGATLRSGGEDTTLTVGDDLTEGLLDSDSDTNFDWTRVSAEEARAGLADGTYYAVLVIPADFSQTVASAMTLDDGGAGATRAELTLTTDDATSYVTGTVARSIGQALQAEVRSNIGEQYLSAVYLGFTDIHDSLGDAVAGASDVADGADRVADGAADLEDGAADLATGASDASAGADSLSGGLDELRARVSGLPTGLREAADGAEDAAAGAGDLSGGLEQLRTGTADLDSGAQDALAGATTLSENLDALAASTPDLAAGASEVSTGLDELLAGYAGMSDAQRLATIQALAAGASDVADGAGTVDSSAGQLAAGAQALVGSDGTGMTGLAAGTGSVATGAASAADGAADLDAGLQTLSTELDDAADSAPALVTGIADAADGASDLAVGLTTLDDGAQQLASGTGDLADGSADLDDGAHELSTELADGVDGIPTFTDAQADDLASVTGSAVELDAAREHEVSGYGAGLAPYFLALGLWVGAMAIFFMRPALPDELVARRQPAWRTALRAYLPTLALALAQALVASLVVDRALHLNAASVGALVGISVLASLAFTAVNQGLNALLGPIGRFVALLMTVMQLTSAGGTYPIETTPRVFQVLHEVLPLPYALQAMRSAIAGGDVGYGQAVVVLAGWFVVGLVMLIAGVVVASRRAARAAQSDGAPSDGVTVADAVAASGPAAAAADESHGGSDDTDPADVVPSDVVPSDVDPSDVDPAVGQGAEDASAERPGDVGAPDGVPADGGAAPDGHDDTVPPDGHAETAGRPAGSGEEPQTPWRPDAAAGPRHAIA